MPPNFELTLRDDSSRVSHKAMLSGPMLRQVTLDMQPIQMDRIRLAYVARHILIEVDGNLWARIPDVSFMQLHSMAHAGAGESILLDPGQVEYAV